MYTLNLVVDKRGVINAAEIVDDTEIRYFYAALWTANRVNYTQ